MSTPVRIVTVVGARPQFIKAAAVSRAIAEHDARADDTGGRRLEETLIHTGQHYDPNLSQVFFDELNIPPPRHHLGVGSDSHARQTATMLERLEPILLEHKPDWVLIYGDTNSTLAGALAAAKLHIPIAHVEAGLRSRNRRMAEEINRIIADRLSSLLLCPTAEAVRNLAQEGVTDGVHNVGDVMYDSVLHHTARAEQTSTIVRDLSLAPKSYALATIHRAETTDDAARLSGVFDALARLETTVVVPLHPRTRAAAGDAVGRLPPHVRVIDPVAYLDMLLLEKNAAMILTDSGGVQKEAYIFNVPCITLREETEWTELVAIGANRLAGHDPAEILRAAEWAAAWSPSPSGAPLYGDGRAADKIVQLLMKPVLQ